MTETRRRRAGRAALAALATALTVVAVASVPAPSGAAMKFAPGAAPATAHKSFQITDRRTFAIKIEGEQEIYWNISAPESSYCGSASWQAHGSEQLFWSMKFHNYTFVANQKQGKGKFKLQPPLGPVQLTWKRDGSLVSSDPCGSASWPTTDCKKKFTQTGGLDPIYESSAQKLGFGLYYIPGLSIVCPLGLNYFDESYLPLGLQSYSDSQQLITTLKLPLKRLLKLKRGHGWTLPPTSPAVTNHVTIAQKQLCQLLVISVTNDTCETFGAIYWTVYIRRVH